MHRRRAVVREVGAGVGVRRRGDRDDVGCVEAGRVKRQDVVAEAVVPRGRDEEHVFRAGRVDFVEQRLREAASAPAVRQHPHVRAAGCGEGALGLNREVDAFDGVGQGSAAVGIQELDAHHLRGPVHADHAGAVSAGRADRPRHVGAVVVVVHRIARHRGGVESMRTGGAHDRHAIDGDGEGRRRRPHVCGEIGMRVVDAGVDDRDDVRGGTERDVPRLHRLDVGAWDADRTVHHLADVLEAPQLWKAGIVRLRQRVHDVVRLGVEHVGMIGEQLEERGHVERPCSKPSQTGTADRLDGLGAGGTADFGEQTALRRASEFHEHFVRGRLAAVHALGAGVCALCAGRGARDEQRGERCRKNRQTDENAIHQSSRRERAHLKHSRGQQLVLHRNVLVAHVLRSHRDPRIVIHGSGGWLRTAPHCWTKVSPGTHFLTN